METQQNQAIKDLSLAFVRQYVPEEVEIFDEVAEEYFADSSSFEQPESDDSALGFGADIYTSILTPVVLAITVLYKANPSDPNFRAKADALATKLGLSPSKKETIEDLMKFFSKHAK